MRGWEGFWCRRTLRPLRFHSLQMLTVGFPAAHLMATRDASRRRPAVRRAARSSTRGRRRPRGRTGEGQAKEDAERALGCGRSAEERLEKLQIATSLTPFRFQEQNERREVFVDRRLVTEGRRKGAGVSCRVCLVSPSLCCRPCRPGASHASTQ